MPDFYEQLTLERKTWIPVVIPEEPLKTHAYGVQEMMEKAIALCSRLEMPVGAFIGDATREILALPSSAIVLLKSNIKDETIHDRQFQLLMQTYPVRDEIMEEADAIAAEWICHPDSTLSKAKELETGVLLIVQSLLRFFGGQSIDRMASDISQDEWRHLQTNWSVCEELGLRSSQSLLKLCKRTLDWVISNLQYPTLSHNFWHRQSDLMVANGEAPEMEAVFNWATKTSFFEIDGRHLSAYG